MVKYLDALEAHEPFALGELHVTFDGDMATIAAPGAEAGEEVPCDPDAIRERLRHDEHGRYRPLTGARTLPGGWFTRCPVDDLEGVLDIIYPLAIAHARQLRDGNIRLVPLDDVLSRQSGRYSDVAGLSEDGRRVASEELCGACVRVPLWRGDVDESQGIPCPEPCSVLVSLCREALAWDQDATPPSEVDYSVPYADFEAPGNEVRERYLSRVAAGHATS